MHERHDLEIIVYIKEYRYLSGHFYFILQFDHIKKTLDKKN